MRALLGLLVAIANVACGGSTGAQPGGAGSGGGSAAPLDAGDTPPTPPNGALLCPAGECNYQTNAGCGAAASCVPDPLLDAAVVPRCSAAGTTPFGGSCASWTECAEGAVCVAGACRKLCCGKDWTGCPSGEHCVSKLDLLTPKDAAAWSGAYVCLPTTGCDALAAGACTSGQACQIIDPTGATDCIAGPASGSGAGLAGLACPCQTGFVCVSQACRRLCRTAGGEPSCPADEGRCVHLRTDPSGVGECVP
jgi:hypothetical protein